MSRRTLPLLLAAFTMLTGLLLPALRVAACLTSTSGTGCPMKAVTSASSIEAVKPADKHGCCMKKSPKTETKVITGACCCTIKAAAKPIIRDYRTALNAVDTACILADQLQPASNFILTATATKRISLDEHISRGPPRGSSPHRGPPSIS